MNNNEFERQHKENIDKFTLEYYQEKDRIKKEKARAYYYAKRKGRDPATIKEENTSELARLQKQWIGEVVNIQLGGLTITVRILGVKVSYGNVRYLVQPITGGNASIWVQKIEVINS